MATPLRINRLGAAVATAALVALAGTTTAQAAPSTPPPAPTTASASAATSAAAAVDYATWQADVRKVTDEARPYLEQRIADGSGQKKAIVLDIDNTSLETYFSPFPPSPAVAPTLDLARYADAHGVAVFFITARPDFIGWVTKPNLTSVGYPVTGLYERSIGDLFGDAGTYKASKRADIERRGYTIIANIGNNTSDFVGGHAEKTFKLPDYDGALS
ncbi:HAD family acid phosphatase [Streptomyces liangshanensis]|uniref:Hydrolase n=1 Tax=Streptomyces liangshanensis TaxID=2717324 RepID=A0A6G9H208_9ACTN|nr:HAD family acid phosphatase [Streptomyces liangshanensis]QIQ04356.1 hydrolase [Streptomyces liangshanensis]